MEFASEVQKASFEKMVAFMSDIFGEAAQLVEDVPIVSVMVGSAVLLVSVLPAGTEEATKACATRSTRSISAIALGENGRLSMSTSKRSICGLLDR